MPHPQTTSPKPAPGLFNCKNAFEFVEEAGAYGDPGQDRCFCNSNSGSAFACEIVGSTTNLYTEPPRTKGGRSSCHSRTLQRTDLEENCMQNQGRITDWVVSSDGPYSIAPPCFCSLRAPDTSRVMPPTYRPVRFGPPREEWALDGKGDKD